MSLLVIIFALFVGASEIDIIVPSFPQMQEFFHISPFVVELTLGANLLAHCIAALIVGNLGDKYGKKSVIKWGFTLFILGSVIGGVASSFSILLIARIIQGIGVAPAVVLSYLIEIEKKENESEKSRIIGIINGASTLGIAFAPAIGSYVNFYLGWRGNFWIMGIMGIMALTSFNIFIRKDAKPAFFVKPGFLDYFTLLQNKRIFLYVASLCFAIGAYYTFVGMASFVYINSMKVSVKNFGFHLGSLTLAFGAISIFSGKITKMLSQEIAFYISLGLILGCIIINLAIVISDINNPFIITFAMFLQSIGFVIPCNALFTLAISVKPEASGKVSALISTFKWIVTIAGVQAASFFYKESYAPVGYSIIIMLVISIALTMILWKEDERMKKVLLGRANSVS